MVKIEDTEIEIFAEYIKENVDLTLQLPDEYFYSHLPLCVVDAVYSIGVNYTSTIKIPIRYCDHLKIDRIRKDRSSIFPNIQDQNSVSDMLEMYNKYGTERMADEIFKNKQRTSSRNGILKSEAVKYFAETLKNFDVNYFQDLYKVRDNDAFSKKIKCIPGQSSGVSLKYFFMLAGDENIVKPDRMLKRFIATALGKEEINISDYVVQYVIEAVFNKRIFRNVSSIRHLDFLIWKYQSQKK